MANPRTAPSTPAAQQPVVHDDQPADADHGAPSQGEVIDDAEFAGKSNHGLVCHPERSSCFASRSGYAVEGPL